MKRLLDCPVIDMHTHLRSEIKKHTILAKFCGIDAVVYMANCQPPLDSPQRIKDSLAEERSCLAIPVSAITKELKGKELVDINEIKPLVVGFSDDGKLLEDLTLLKTILKKKVLLLLHCSPPFEAGLENPHLETRWVAKYLRILEETGGLLHVQHVSKKGTVETIRAAKRRGIKITCETCPHYFSYTKYELETKVNPPLATKNDLVAIKEGLADGTIDVIASDYAPLPRITGIAGFRAFLPLSYGLVLEGVLTEKQLKEKLFDNPKRIIESGGYRLNLE